jgi:uncharacterized protein
MDKRILGKTGLAVTIVGYGAIKLPNISQAEADECLNLALDLGINYIDTARSYRDSEEKIGKAISHRRDEFYIATKTGARDAKGVEEHLAISLGNLRTDYIDLYQLHTVSDRERWEAVRAPGGAYEAALQAREAGKVGHIGITIHRDLQVMREAIASGLFETIMVCYNPLDSENVEPEILPAAEAADMGVIVMKSLSGGQLCQPLEQREAGLGGPDAIVAGSLRYVLGNPNVSLVIPGMQAVHEIRENVTVGEEYTPLSADEQQQLMRLIARQKGDYRYEQVCLRCGYCKPCTVGIDIPAVFKAGDMLAAYSENLHHVALEVWESLEVSPDECVECGQCLEKCPAGINIPEQLKRVTTAFAEYRQRHE